MLHDKFTERKLKIMRCNICGRIDHCVPSCPNYNQDIDGHKSEYYCDFCGSPILPGDFYYKNYRGNYIHGECISSVTPKQLLNWLGEEMRIMNNE